MKWDLRVARSISLFSINQYSIALAINLVLHQRTKHIKIQAHFIR